MFILEFENCFAENTLILKTMRNSIHINVFKSASAVYFEAFKGYVRMMCCFKVGYQETRELVAFPLDLLINQRLRLHLLLFNFVQKFASLQCINWLKHTSFTHSNPISLLIECAKSFPSGSKKMQDISLSPHIRRKHHCLQTTSLFRNTSMNCPFLKFSYLITNQAIIESLEM